MMITPEQIEAASERGKNFILTDASIDRKRHIPKEIAGFLADKFAELQMQGKQNPDYDCVVHLATPQYQDLQNPRLTAKQLSERTLVFTVMAKELGIEDQVMKALRSHYRER